MRIFVSKTYPENAISVRSENTPPQPPSIFFSLRGQLCGTLLGSFAARIRELSGRPGRKTI